MDTPNLVASDLGASLRAGDVARVPGTLRRRGERPADAGFVFELFRETHGGILAGLDPALADNLLRQQMAGRAMTYAARYPAACAEVVEREGAPIGRLVLDRGATAITLVDIALCAQWRGRGLGTRLVREVLRDAATAALPVRLTVAAGNPAQRLYARLGFVPVASGALDIEMHWGRTSAEA